MGWRLTFFVQKTERTADGWAVAGQDGLGPPQVGDVFVAVQHLPGVEESLVLQVEGAHDHGLVLVGDDDVELRPGDILIGERGR